MIVHQSPNDNRRLLKAADVTVRNSRRRRRKLNRSFITKWINQE